MTDPFRTPEDYELFLYGLAEHFPSIRHSTLTFVRRGHSLARISGELHFDGGFRLVVLERVTFDRLPIVIEGYGYEVWRGEEKLYWYDSQPHPNRLRSFAVAGHGRRAPLGAGRPRGPGGDEDGEIGLRGFLRSSSISLLRKTRQP